MNKKTNPDRVVEGLDVAELDLLGGGGGHHQQQGGQTEHPRLWKFDKKNQYIK